MPAEPADRTRAAGFSLIEMLVVLVILSLAAGLVMAHRPGVSPGLQVHVRASEVAATLRLARGQAIATNVPVRIVVAGDGMSLLVNGVAGAPAPIPLRIERPDGVAALAFLPDGSASGGMIEVGAGPARWRVSVEWRTGRIMVNRAL